MTMRQTLFIAAVALLFVSPFAAQPVDAQERWVNCAREGGVCNTPPGATVRYGANGAYALRQSNGAISCSNATFGDPIFNVVKSCAYRVSTSTPTQRINVLGRDLSAACSGSFSNAYRNMRGPKAFAITRDGNSCSWRNAGTLAEAQGAAMQGCRARFLKECEVIHFTN